MIRTARVSRGRVGPSGPAKGGFTLLELLTVAAIVGILFSLLVPALTASKRRAQGVVCLNNLKHVHLAWAMYAQDNGDILPGVAGGSFPGSDRWVSGWLAMNGSPDNTNTVYLTDREFSQVGPYLRSAAPYRCPADRSTVRIGGRDHPRVRSISMNCWMNYVGSGDIGQDRYRIFRRLTDIVDPPPDKAWVLIDEREDSINDGMFQTNLKDRRSASKIVDYPAAYHGGAAGIIFADGHGEIKRWRDRRTIPQLHANQIIQLGVNSPDNPDVAWLQERSSSPLPVE
jgi:prepilin-type N-terminal cleavage/methylation domain-containing protein/prepilin-type processing-associated H-X9-DG protein